MSNSSKQVLDVDLSQDSFDTAVDLVEKIISPLLIAKECKSGADESIRLYRSLIYSLYMLHYSAVGLIAGDEMREIIDTAESHIQPDKLLQAEIQNESIAEIYS